MPRRTVAKCSRLSSGDRPDETDELCLAVGHAFGVADWEKPLQSRAEFMRLWSRWGAEITRRWSRAYPGSRPVGCYLAGEIEPPDWRHANPNLRHPVRVGGVVALDDRAWHCREVELDHLVGLGLVDADEHEAAVERLAGPEPVSVHRYERLADA
jgi:hypothetical protein